MDHESEEITTTCHAIRPSRSLPRPIAAMSKKECWKGDGRGQPKGIPIDEYREQRVKWQRELQEVKRSKEIVRRRAKRLLRFIRDNELDDRQRRALVEAIQMTPWDRAEIPEVASERELVAAN